MNLFTSRCVFCREVTFTDKPKKLTICTDCQKKKENTKGKDGI